MRPKPTIKNHNFINLTYFSPRVDDHQVSNKDIKY